MGKKNRRRQRKSSQEGSSEQQDPSATRERSNNRKRRKKQHQPAREAEETSTVSVAGASATSSSKNQEEKDKTENHADETVQELATHNNNNPFWAKLQSFLATLTPDERRHFFSDHHVTPERRADIWAQQSLHGSAWINQYAWAVPSSDACFAILRHFAPLIELGCGANAYWARQCRARGVDVVAYDKSVGGGGRIAAHDDNDGDNISSKKRGKKKNKSKNSSDEFVVQHGGPEVLTQHADRTLFLCYPDENDGEDEQEETDNENEPMSLGQACLQHYQGQYLIHVGELYGDTLSVPQAPWGRSSSPLFQQQLAADFHCVLRLPLTGWLHVRDTLTVWKRTELCTMVFAGGASDEEEDDENDMEEVEEVEYRYVPPEEQLPQSFAAPYLAHLLPSSQEKSTA